MKLSIIVPVYNVEKLLPECLDSLVNQTIDDYEIILINDGSKDNSWGVIEEYCSKYPELITAKSIPNGGQGNARNIGISLAKGDYIGFVDSDDWISTDMYEKLYKSAVETGSDIVCCDIEERRADGTTRYVNLSNIEDRMSTGGSACNRLFKRSFIGDIRFPVGVWYEDFDFITKLILKGAMLSAVHEPLYFYRIGENTTMKNNNAAKNLDIITVIEDIRSFAGESSEEEIKYLILNHVVLEAIKRVEAQNSPDKAEVLKKLRDYAHNNITNLTSYFGFKAQPRNTKIVMWLNYHGLSALSVKLLGINSSMRK